MDNPLLLKIDISIEIMCITLCTFSKTFFCSNSQNVMFITSILYSVFTLSTRKEQSTNILKRQNGHLLRPQVTKYLSFQTIHGIPHSLQLNREPVTTLILLYVPASLSHCFLAFSFAFLCRFFSNSAIVCFQVSRIFQLYFQFANHRLQLVYS